jgi:hypothetical protein
MIQEAVELSTAPVDPSVFEPPRGYRTASLEDLIRQFQGR